MRSLNKYPFFLLLLPIFFVLHGYTENFDNVPTGEAIRLTIVYILAGTMITFLAWLFYRDVSTAAIIAFLLLSYHFFFGTLQDLLRNHFPGTFFARYSFILPFSLLVFVLFLILLRKKKGLFNWLSLYLNCLLLLLIAIDIIWLTSKMSRNPQAMTSITVNQTCDTCNKPDIYLIILDGYSGNNTLVNYFNFKNTAFEAALKQRNFHVVNNSRSNYNYTPFSIASMFNMLYLDLDMKTKGSGNLDYSYRLINRNQVMNFLYEQGYLFYNFSIFDFNRYPAPETNNFLLTRTRLITSQTFLSRLWKDIQFNTSTGKWKIKSINKGIVYEHLRINEKLSQLMLDATKDKRSPKFVYTHLMMPHYPYYFDSLGHPLPYDSLVEGGQFSKRNYISYLQYCNNEVLKYADTILHHSTTPPIIILASDHGFRHFQKLEERKKYCFDNLTAILMPSRKYNQFKDSMSLVNLFPGVLNTQFQQVIPLQKDSTIYLWED